MPKRRDPRDGPALPVDPNIRLCMNYLRLERGRSPQTIDAYTRDLELFGAFLEGIAPENAHGKEYPALPTVTSTDIRRFIADLSGPRGYSMVSVRRKISSVKAFFRWLEMEGRRNDDPGRRIPAPKIDKKLPKVLPLDDVDTLLATRVATKNTAKGLRDRAIMELLYASGLRRAEITKIDLVDVNLDTRELQVHGKGSKERLVPINRTAAEAIGRYLDERPRSSDDALFLARGKGGGHRMTPRHVWHIFRQHYLQSGVKRKASPHTLRHSFATHLHAGGADLLSIKEMLGHESVATTQVYTHLTTEHKRKAYDMAHPRDRAVGG